MADRNRCFHIAILLLAASYLMVTGNELIEAVHFFQQHVIVESEISISIRAAAHLVGACGWVLVATAFGTRIDWSRLLLGSVVVGSAFLALLVSAVLELIPRLASFESADTHGVYRWETIGSMLLVLGAAVIIAGLLESRRGPDLAPRLQVGLVFATLSTAALTVSALYLQSANSSRGYVAALPIGTLVVAIADLGLVLVGLAVALGIRWPLARREARLAGAAAGAALASLCFAAGQGLITLAFSDYGSPTWYVITAWINTANSVVLVVAYAYIASGARSAADWAVREGLGAAEQ